MNTVYDYNFLGSHPSVKGILLYVFVLLPIPALIDYFSLADSPVSAGYPYLLILGLVAIPFGIHRDKISQPWYQSIELTDDGIIIDGDAEFEWTDIESVKQIKKSEEDYFVFTRKSFRVLFKDGTKLRIFTSINGYEDIMTEVMGQFYKER